MFKPLFCILKCKRLAVRSATAARVFDIAKGLDVDTASPSHKIVFFQTMR